MSNIKDSFKDLENSWENEMKEIIFNVNGNRGVFVDLKVGDSGSQTRFENIVSVTKQINNLAGSKVTWEDIEKALIYFKDLNTFEIVFKIDDDNELAINKLVHEVKWPL